MITVQQASDWVLAQKRDFGIEYVELAASIGRVLAIDVYGDREMPPFDRVTMDGIAINYAAWHLRPAPLPIEGVSQAGHPRKSMLDPTSCIEVMTGAMLPEHCDTVIRYEDVHIQGDMASIVTPEIKLGQNIHRKGSDRPAGEKLLHKGAMIHAGMLNSLATVGIEKVAVFKNPITSILATGDEIIPINKVPADHEIRMSNAYAIQGLLIKEGVDATIHHVPDDAKLTEAIVGSALRHSDVVIIIGGVSAGKYDLVPNVLKKLEVQLGFHQVAQRPGKPMWCGVGQKGVLVFALPGNPVSSFMCARRYVVEWLKTVSNTQVIQEQAILGSPVLFKPNLTYFMLVSLNLNEGKLIANPIDSNGSGDLSALNLANAFIELPMDRESFVEGDVFNIYRF